MHIGCALHTCIHMWAHVHAWMNACVHAPTHLSTVKCMNAHMHGHMHTQMHAYYRSLASDGPSCCWSANRGRRSARPSQSAAPSGSPSSCPRFYHRRPSCSSGNSHTPRMYRRRGHFQRSPPVSLEILSPIGRLSRLQYEKLLIFSQILWRNFLKYN